MSMAARDWVRSAAAKNHRHPLNICTFARANGGHPSKTPVGELAESTRNSSRDHGRCASLDAEHVRSTRSFYACPKSSRSFHFMPVQKAQEAQFGAPEKLFRASMVAKLLTRRGSGNVGERRGRR
jgi:hypothetical protein